MAKMMARNTGLFLLAVIVIQLSVLSVAILDSTDFLALKSIRNGLNDTPGSNFFSTWNFTSNDPCNFTGVYCEGDKVIALNLGDPKAGSPGLTGNLDSAIGNLSALAEFTVAPGRITGSFPSSLSHCKNLRFLAINRNFISGNIPSSLGQLRRLQILDLSYNQFTGEIPPSIGNLTALSIVILSHNRLSGSIPPFSSKTLTRLDLKHNNLSGSFSPSSLPSSLEHLSLSWNRFSGPMDRVLNRTERLKYLDLSMNRFTGTIPVRLFTFPITKLQLQRNSFSGSVLPLDFVSITTVDLSYNRFSGSISPLFSTVQNLYLNNNRFTGLVPTSLVNRIMTAGSQILYLQHNYLTGIEMSPTDENTWRNSMCLQYNCMLLPVENLCPFKAGKQKVRPSTQCNELN